MSIPELSKISADRTVMGPFATIGGLRAWYFVCLPDCIIALPQGFWTSFLINSWEPDAKGKEKANTAATGALFGVLGVAAFEMIRRAWERKHKRLLESLSVQSLSTLSTIQFSRFNLTGLKAIQYKPLEKVSIHRYPEVTLERKTGAKTVYSTKRTCFEPLMQELHRLYPEITTSAV